jgi:hypothetical protein
MAILQKVCFCNSTCKNFWLFSACQRKKIFIGVVSCILLLTFSFCVTVPEDEYIPEDLQEEEPEPKK